MLFLYSLRVGHSLNIGLLVWHSVNSYITIASVIVEVLFTCWSEWHFIDSYTTHSTDRGGMSFPHIGLGQHSIDSFITVSTNRVGIEFPYIGQNDIASTAIYCWNAIALNFRVTAQQLTRV